jgi:hypothetical protein
VTPLEFYNGGVAVCRGGKEEVVGSLMKLAMMRRRETR